MSDEWRARSSGSECAYNERLSEAMALIESGSSLEHSASTLWSHLVNTFQILEAWKAPQDVCLAGLLHSIYSTQYFKSALVSNSRRREVASRVGNRAEQLAHWFCILDRESIRLAKHGGPGSDGNSIVRMHLNGRGVRVPHSTLRRLRLIDVANEVEQQQRLVQGASTWLSTSCATLRSIGFVPPHLSGIAALSISEELEAELRRTYESAMVAAEDDSRRLLLRCIELHSHCAEAKILLASMDLEDRRWASAFIQGRSGLRDLRGWGAAWDTRVPMSAWELLGEQLIERARAPSDDLPELARQVRVRLSAAIDSDTFR